MVLGLVAFRLYLFCADDGLDVIIASNILTIDNRNLLRKAAFQRLVKLKCRLLIGELAQFSKGGLATVVRRTP